MNNSVNTESQILNVPIEDIIPNRFQPRLTFDEEGLNELAASIKEHGIIQPLVLRRIGDKYEIIAGERRYKASKIAGLTTVPAIISLMNDKESAEVAIVENVQRRDLTAIEEAKSYKSLLDKGYLTQDELAKKMGLSQSAISNKLRLLSLDESVQQALMDGKISERHARTLLKLNSHEDQAKWLQRIIDERLTVQNLEKRLKDTINNEEENIVVNNQTVFNDYSIPSTNNTLEKNSFSMESEVSKQTEENKNENIIEQEKISYPNTFYNYFEDEQSNINPIEAQISNIDDEIELLDFDITEPVLKDMNKANLLVDTLISDLKSNNYDVSLVKDENDKEIKYTITVKEED